MPKPKARACLLLQHGHGRAPLGHGTQSARIHQCACDGASTGFHKSRDYCRVARANLFARALPELSQGSPRAFLRLPMAPTAAVVQYTQQMPAAQDMLKKPMIRSKDVFTPMEGNLSTGSPMIPRSVCPTAQAGGRTRRHPGARRSGVAKR